MTMRVRGRPHSLVRLGCAAAAVAMLACSGCSTAPGLQCQGSRPAWRHSDAQAVRAKKAADGERWDNRCTMVGIISSAAAGRL
jgi:hypothetical protein